MLLATILLSACVLAVPEPVPVPAATPTPVLQADLDDFARLFARSDEDVRPAQDYADQLLALIACHESMYDEAELAALSAGEQAAFWWIFWC